MQSTTLPTLTKAQAIQPTIALPTIEPAIEPKTMPPIMPTAAMLTKHHKLPLVAPSLAQVGIIVQLYAGYDTDTLGTFAGEIPRQQSPLECVKTKAKLAAEFTGLRFGVGSEGSFGGGPMPGIVNWDDELLCLFDSENQQYIVARAAGPVPLSTLVSAELSALQTHIAKTDVKQAWICSSNGLLGKDLIGKGLVGFAAVRQWLAEQQLLQDEDRCIAAVTLSPDLRAHYCPSRQDYIRQAAEQLAERLRAKCPLCQAVDFWPKAIETGLACADCDFPTPAVKNYLLKCDCCGHQQTKPVATTFADPSQCPRCNP